MSNANEVIREVLFEVMTERIKQDLKWGEQNHPNGTSIEKYAPKASIAKAYTDEAAKNGKLTWAAILEEEFYEALAEEDPDALRIELTQVAAVASGWIEAIDRAKLKRQSGV